MHHIPQHIFIPMEQINFIDTMHTVMILSTFLFQAYMYYQLGAVVPTSGSNIGGVSSVVRGNVEPTRQENVYPSLLDIIRYI